MRGLPVGIFNAKGECMKHNVQYLIQPVSLVHRLSRKIPLFLNRLACAGHDGSALFHFGSRRQKRCTDFQGRVVKTARRPHRIKRNPCTTRNVDLEVPFKSPVITYAVYSTALCRN